jgi:hypothetical protein
MRLHKYITIAALLLVATTAGAQVKKIDLMNGIRKEVAFINKEAGLTKRLLENEQLTEQVPDGGASLTGFYRKGVLVKIVEWTGLSNGISIREYYFRNNLLLFVYERFSIYPFDEKKQELDRTLTKVIYEGRSYYRNGKLFDTVTKGKNPLQEDPTRAPDFTAKAKDLTATLARPAKK